MGEDRLLRHPMLQHHVSLRCDSAGWPPQVHLTWSAMTPGATPARAAVPWPERACEPGKTGSREACCRGSGPGRLIWVPADCGWERAGRAVRAACIASRPIGVTLSSSYREPS